MRMIGRPRLAFLQATLATVLAGACGVDTNEPELRTLERPRSPVPRLCTPDAVSGTCENGVAWTITPFSAGAAPAVFQSTGDAQVIIVEFSAAVTQVKITAYNHYSELSAYAETPEGTFIGSPFAPTIPAGGPASLTFAGPLLRLRIYPSLGYQPGFRVEVGTGAPMSVQCTPSAPVRGATVRCTASLVSPQAFRVVQKRGVVAGRTTVVNEEVTEHAAGGSAEWEGKAVTSTNVIFTVQLDDSAGTTLTDSASYLVQPRTWPNWVLTTLDRRISVSVTGCDHIQPLETLWAASCLSPLNEKLSPSSA